MEFKSETLITVSRDTLLKDIEPFKSEGLPSETVLYKGRCGIGGTTMELKHNRHSIITVPTIAPIINKLNLSTGDECKPKDGIFPLMSRKGLKREIKIKRIEEY